MHPYFLIKIHFAENVFQSSLRIALFCRLRALNDVIPLWALVIVHSIRARVVTLMYLPIVHANYILYVTQS